MMIPCIDLQDGRAVQLVHGRERKLAVDDVFGLLDRFGGYPLIHVIDLDAAMRKGSNAKLVRATVRCGKKTQDARARRRRNSHGGAGRQDRRLGSGENYRGQRRIQGWPRERGVSQHVWPNKIGTAADDRRAGHRAAEKSWFAAGRKNCACGPDEVIPELEKYASGFLVHLRGCGRHHARHESRVVPRTATRHAPAHHCRRRHSQPREIRALARMKMDAAVGMALYTGKLS